MFLAQLCANCSIEVSGRGVILLHRAPTNKVLNATMRGHHLCMMGTAMSIDGQVQAPWTSGQAALMKAAGAAVSWRAAPVVPGPQLVVNFVSDGTRYQWHAVSSCPWVQHSAVHVL